jgi:uncharacterized membrane protein HdeD (DUF308 family)
MNSDHTLEQKFVKHLRNVFIFKAVVNIIFGLLALFWPQISLIILITFFGIKALFGGFSMLFSSFLMKTKSAKFLVFLEGFFSLFIALITFLLPGITALILLYIIAFWSAIIGGIKISQGIFFGTKLTGTFWLGLTGGSYLLLSFYLLVTSPVEGALSVVKIIGFFSLIGGLGLLLTALKISHLKKKLEE